MSLSSNDSPKDLDIRDILRIIWRRKIFIVALVVSAMLISGVLSLFVFPKEYKATSIIAVTPQNLTPVELEDSVAIDDPFTRLTPRTKTEYVQSILSSSVLVQVIDELSLEDSLSELLSVILIQDVEKTSLVRVSVTYSDPQMAQRIAQTLCTVYEKQVQTDRQLELDDAIEFAQFKIDSLDSSLSEFKNEKKAFLDQHDIEAISNELIRLTASIDTDEARLTELERQIAVDAAYVETLRETYEVLAQIPASTIDFEINMNRNEEFDGSFSDFEISGDTLSESLLIADYTAAQLRLISASYEKTILEADLLEIYKRMDSIDAELIEFSGEYDDLMASIELTQSKLKVYRQRNSELTEHTETELSASVVRIVSEAVADAKPVSPNVPLNVLIAGILGLFLSYIIIYFMDVIWMTADASTPSKKSDKISEPKE